MVRDLDDVIRTGLDERAARLEGAVLDPGTFATLVKGVRRRRRKRQIDRAVTGVGGLAVLAVALALGGGHGSSTSAHTPSPTATRYQPPAPSPTDTTEPIPTPPPPPRPAQAEIDAGLGLPATLAAPDGIWSQVGAGWVLGIYRPTWGSQDLVPLRNTLVLSSPTGTSYRLHELPADRDVALVRWTPGARRALVTIAPVDVASGYVDSDVRGWLDLRTGALTPDPGAVGAPDSTGTAPQISFFGTDHKGDEIWFVTYGLTGGGGPGTVVVERPDGTLVRHIDLAGGDPQWGGALLDPSGRLIVLPGHDDAGGGGYETSVDVVDLDTGRELAHPYGVPDRYCWVIGWSTASELLTRCATQPWDSSGSWERSDSPGDPWYLLRLDGRPASEVRTLATGDPGAGVVAGTGSALPDGRLLIGAIPIGSADAGPCMAGLYAVDRAGGVRALPVDPGARVRPSGTRGTRIYVESDAGCDESGTSRTLLESLDGATRTLLLRPAASVDPSLGDALSSWAVAGGPSGRPGV